MDFGKVKVVLFDLDGTLLDTLLDIGTCVNETLERFGYPTHELSKYKNFVGHGARNLVRSALPAGTPEETVIKVQESYAPYYRANSARLTEYFPGVREYLSFLTEKGYRLGIITNKTQATAETIVARYFPEYHFEILWGNNYVRPLKPSLETAELACETLGVKPDEVLFVGDGDTDVEFASKAGFIACGVTWGYRSRETLVQYGADFLVDSFPQLQEMMQ